MYNIFLVDDEKHGLIDLQKSLDWERFNMEITNSFSNPIKALEAIELLNPDAVFCDVKMPKLLGTQLIEIARNNGYTGEFIIVSSYADFEYAKSAIKNNVFYYLLKPINSEEGNNVLYKLSQKMLSKQTEHKVSAINKVTTENIKLNEILQYIDVNLSSPITLPSLCSHFNLSSTSICVLFKKYLNTTFVNYLNNRKFEFAKHLLENTDLTINEISNKIGFNDYFYFARCFKKNFNCSPTQYRRKINEENKI